MADQRNTTPKQLSKQRPFLTRLRFAVNISFYYMALSHKDWELPSSRIWLAEINIDRGLDFPI